jgi:hypothetical protein
LNDLLEDRLSTFLYSKRQGELAGTDGEKTFNEVFGGDARTVVVLYRDGWGKTPWTRIEETAIRNRGFEDGYDFVIFVKLDHSSTIPRWLPKNRIGVGLERWGEKGAASVIEARVQEAGGTSREETAEEKAMRICREIQARERRKGFLESHEGVNTATNEVTSLPSEMKKIALKIEERDSAFVFDFKRSQRLGEFSVESHAFTLFFEWIIPISNSLEGSVLFVQLIDNKRRGWRHHADPNREQASIIREDKFHFGLNLSGQMGWYLENQQERLMPTSQLAEHCMKVPLDGIRESKLASK